MNPFVRCATFEDEAILRCEVNWSSSDPTVDSLQVSFAMPRIYGEEQRQTDQRAIEKAKVIAERFARLR